jgi:hypothetical protein
MRAEPAASLRPAELHGVRIDWANPYGSAREGAEARPREPIADLSAYARAMDRFVADHAHYLSLRARMDQQREQFADAVDEGPEPSRSLAASITRDAVEYCVLDRLLKKARAALLEFAERYALSHGYAG